MNILALDVGLDYVKAAVLDAGSGKPLASTRVDYATDQPTADAYEVPAPPPLASGRRGGEQAVRKAASRAGLARMYRVLGYAV